MPNTLTVVPPGVGATYALTGDVITIKAGGAQTGGAYALMDMLVVPGGGPPPHRHKNEDESFFVLDGEMTFHADGKSTTLGPGGFIHLPRGSAHRFQNTGKTRARVVVVTTPAGFENFVAEAGVPVTEPAQLPNSLTPEALSKVIAVAAKHGIEIVA